MLLAHKVLPLPALIPLKYLAFLSRYEETPEERKRAETYRLVVITEEGFLVFIKAWASWLTVLPKDDRLFEAAE